MMVSSESVMPTVETKEPADSRGLRGGFERLTSVPGLHAHWTALASSACSFIQLPVWVVGLQTHLSANYPHLEPLSFTATRGAVPVGAAVFCRKRRSAIAGIPLNVLTTLNHSNALFSDGLLATDVDSDHIAEVLLRTKLPDGAPWHVMELTGVRAESALFRLCSRLPGTEIDPEPDVGAAIIDTSCTYGEWEGRLSAATRKDLHRAQRRLEAERGARIEVASTPTEMAGAFTDFMALENSGWKRGKGALADGSPVAGLEREMTRDLLACLCATGDAGILRLLLGDRLIGSQVWARVDATVFGMKTAYAEDHADLAPGKVLLGELVRRCCADLRITRLDWVGAAESVLRWGSRIEETYTVRALNGRTLLGSLAIARRRLRNSRSSKGGAR